SAGKAVPAKTFEGGWEPAGRPASATLFPGKWTDTLLIFAAPSPTGGDLHLELPGNPVGSGETVRFKLPQAWLKSRSSKPLGAETQWPLAPMPTFAGIGNEELSDEVVYAKIQEATRIHPHRTAGGNCHHLAADGAADAGSTESPRGGEPHQLRQQPQAAWPGHP